MIPLSERVGIGREAERLRFFPATFALAGLLAAAAGCASPRPEAADAPVVPPPAFSDSGDAEVPDRWWRVFADSALDSLVAHALRDNLDLATAWERLHEARAFVDLESAAGRPTLDAEAAGEARRPETAGGDHVLLGLTAGYEVDLWGRIGSAVEAERYRARASLADYRTVALSLSAAVVNARYRLVEAREQHALLLDQVATNEKALRLFEARFGSGQVRAVDILRQRQLVEATRQQASAAAARVDVLEHRLAVLLGRPPGGEFAVAARGLPALPPLPVTGVPVDLLLRRPDVQRAHALLQAADRDLASAVSARYPRLSLSASVATRSDAAEGLFADWFGALAGNLVAPLLRGGELRAEVDRTASVRRQRLHEYGQTVLLALQEVEDALVLETRQTEQIERLAAQVELAGETLRRIRTEYLNGVADYLEVLVALTSLQRLERDLLAARRERLEIRVGLYRALAGGFATAREAS